MGNWNKILVGVDGSEHSRKALEWAADAAAQHGSEVTVLTAYLPSPPPLGGVSATHSTHDTADVGAAAKELLMDTIQAVLGEDPPYLVQPQVKEGNPAEVLIERSGDVDLVVVGSRGHGGFAGLLLGSVSQHVAAHAKCTVVVAR